MDKKEKESSEYFGLLCETGTGSTALPHTYFTNFPASELSDVVIPAINAGVKG
ncbi:MAG: hypothetical protein JW957_02120 [Candidatus Omnitrophica bacterium]|nr:hypothetical protein [Candidatus Omnitrophota bacterium]